MLPGPPLPIPAPNMGQGLPLPPMPPIGQPGQPGQPLPPFGQVPLHQAAGSAGQGQLPVPMPVPTVPLVPQSQPIAGGIPVVSASPNMPAPQPASPPPMIAAPNFPSWIVIVAFCLILGLIAEVDSMSKNYSRVPIRYAAPPTGSILQKAIVLFSIAAGIGIIFFFSYLPFPSWILTI